MKTKTCRCAYDLKRFGLASTTADASWIWNYSIHIYTSVLRYFRFTLTFTPFLFFLFLTGRKSQHSQKRYDYNVLEFKDFGFSFHDIHVFKVLVYWMCLIHRYKDTKKIESNKKRHKFILRGLSIYYIRKREKSMLKMPHPCKRHRNSQLVGFGYRCFVLHTASGLCDCLNAVFSGKRNRIIERKKSV